MVVFNDYFFSATVPRKFLNLINQLQYFAITIDDCEGNFYDCILTRG